MAITEREVNTASLQKFPVEAKTDLYSNSRLLILLKNYRNGLGLMESSNPLERAEATGRVQIQGILLKILGQGNLLGENDTRTQLNPVKLIDEKEIKMLSSLYSRTRKAYIERDIYGKIWPEGYLPEDAFIEARMTTLTAIFSDLDQIAVINSINVKSGLSKSQLSERRSTGREEIK